jgi:ubiquinone/menaquinone biosynthesis C-methylase UbiE
MNLVVTFTDNQSLTFKLKNSPIAKKIAMLIRQCNKAGYKTGHVSMGLFHTEDDLKYATSVLKDCIRQHNAGDNVKQRICFDESHCCNICTDTLNALHDVYEQNMSLHEVKNRLTKADGYNPTSEYIINLNRINNTIHQLEKCISSIEVGFHEGTISACLVSDRGDTGGSFFEISEGEYVGNKLTEEDRQGFTLGRDFGSLHVGYSTTGKNLIQCYWSNDLKLVKDRKLAPQQIFNTNISIKFPLKKCHHDDEYGWFKEWYDKNDISQYGYTADVGIEGIGYINIGELVMHNDVPVDVSSMNIEQRLSITNDIKKCTLIGYDVDIDGQAECRLIRFDNKVDVFFRHLDEEYFTQRHDGGKGMITSKDYDVHVLDSMQQVEDRLCIQKNDTVLDIGSGFGDVAGNISKKYDSEVYCCDVNSYLLSKAKQNCPKGSNMHFNLVEDDKQPLSFLEDNSIDKAYAYAVFIHNETPTVVNYLKDIKRVLKVGGQFMFNYCNKKLTKGVASNIFEIDKIEIDEAISKLGFKFLKNATSVNSLEGQLYAPQDLWQSVITMVIIEK